MNIRQPLVSVVIPAYNAEKYIGEAIESILNQTFKDFELIIYDDGCKDNTVSIIKRYKDDRIILLRGNINRGVMYGLNQGLEVAKGKYIAMLDSDDVAHPERLQKEVDYLDAHDNVVLVGTRIEKKKDGVICEQPVSPVRTGNQIRFELLFENGSIAHSSFMVRRAILDQYHLRYEIFHYVQDYHLLTRISRCGDLACLEETLVTYRVHEQQATNYRSRRMRTDEFDLARCLYVDSLPLSEEHKFILKKLICRDLHGKDDYRILQQAYDAYRDMCLLKRDDEEDQQCCRYILRGELIQQKHNWALLGYYLRSEYKDKKWLCSPDGLKFVIKCVINYNRCWYSSMVDYRNVEQSVLKICDYDN